MPRKSKRILTGIKLTGMHPSGKSFGYWGDRRVYSAEGVPGETVDLLVHTRQRDWLRGELLKVNVPSEHRVEAMCQHAAICGGCTWQHIEYNEQLRLKHQLVCDAFAKKKLEIPAISPVIASPQLFGFRNKLEFTFSERRWFYNDEGRVDDPAMRRAMGFHPADNSDKVFDVSECHLMPKSATEIAFFVRQYAHEQGFTYFDPKTGMGFLHSLSIRSTTQGEIMLFAVFAQNSPQQIDELLEAVSKQFPALKLVFYSLMNDGQSQNAIMSDDPVNSMQFMTETCLGLKFRVSPGSFYQPNPLQAENIYHAIVQEAALTGVENVTDLYCGVGTISLLLARQAGHVTGIEGSAQAVADAKANAATNRLANATFIHGDILETFTPAYLAAMNPQDLIVLDPPRSGTLISIKKTILASGAKKVIYLSCNHESLANDLQMLCEGYRVVKIQPFDMFPHTAHVETLVVLEKNPDSFSAITRQENKSVFDVQ